MQESEGAGFSMRALAINAGVSIATPYNLFGSKQAIICAVVKSDLRHFREELLRVQNNELDAFFSGGQTCNPYACLRA